MDIICKLFGHKKKKKNILAYVISSSCMNVNVKIYDVCRCDRCGEVILSPLDWYDTSCSDASWKADKEKELLRENGIVSLPEALGLLEEKNDGTARYHPDDTFNFFVGAKPALERLEEAEKPYAWLELGANYYVPRPTVSGLYSVVTYTADDSDKRVMKRGIVFQTKEEAIACAKKMLEVVKRGN